MSECPDPCDACLEHGATEELRLVVAFIKRYADGCHFAGLMKDERALKVMAEKLEDGAHLPGEER